MQRSVVIPFSSESAGNALASSRVLAPEGQVILAGPDASSLDAPPSVRKVDAPSGTGAAVRAGLSAVDGEITVLWDPSRGDTGSLPPLCAPIEAGRADAVYGVRASSARPLSDRALALFGRAVTGAAVSDLSSGQRAFRTEALRALDLRADDEGIDPEILVKLSAQHYRVAEVEVPGGEHDRRRVLQQLARAKRLLHYATAANDADNAHEGYNTLARMDGAVNYNAWIGRKLSAHLGARVLEVGAGIGTITREIEKGRELLIAMEMERFYVERLKNLFRDKPHVRPYLAPVEFADWKGMRKERLDSVVLSNVLEHIEDDAQALRNFSEVLRPGGRVVMLVPALEQLFGATDEAVGHFRRYTKDSLEKAILDAGLTLERPLEFMNLVGVPGWFVNGRILKRRAVPPLQLRLYDALAPYLAEAESHFRVPFGLSLFAVAKKP